ncbi:MAG: DUF2628 domain-containing protein [Rhodobiaceae bacterium]|nr:DUF2628 domain-containing protein [Rhodobiaceae bacterium]
MRTFTVHANASLPRAEDHVRLVKEGMARWAIVSPLIWFLYHRMWWEGAAYFGLSILIALAGAAVGFQENVTVLLGFGLQLIAALEANDLRRLALARKGYQTIAITHGSDEEEAEARFFANWSHALPQGSDHPVTSAVLDRSGSDLGTVGAGQATAYTKPKAPVWPKQSAQTEEQPQPAAPAEEVLGLFPKPPSLN